MITDTEFLTSLGIPKEVQDGYIDFRGFRIYCTYLGLLEVSDKLDFDIKTKVGRRAATKWITLLSEE
jgi:hypothetical protein